MLKLREVIYVNGVTDRAGL